MSISAQPAHSSVKPDPRQRNRRTSDIEQQAYAAVGRRFAESGPVSKRRAMRMVLCGAACLTVLMLVALVGLLTYENINSPHARKVAETAAQDKRAADLALTAGKAVVIIDEKEEAPPPRPATPAEPVPPLVLLAPAELKAAAPISTPTVAPVSIAAAAAAPVRLAPAARAPVKLREPARSALAAGKLAAAKAGKAVQPPAARKGSRKTAPPAPAKRKVAMASAAGADGGPLTTLISRANGQRHYLAQPLPVLAGPAHPARRRPLSER